MDITIIDNYRSKRNKTIKLKEGMVFVHLTEEEAIAFALSLLSQINEKDSNSGRIERYDESGTYFSISVSDYKYSGEEFEALKEKVKMYEESIYADMYGTARAKERKKVRR